MSEDTWGWDPNTAEEALAQIESVVEQRLVEPETWYSALSSVREILEDYHDMVNHTVVS